LGTATSSSSTGNSDNEGGASTLRSYEYDGWKLTYRTIPEDNNSNNNGNNNNKKDCDDDHHNVLLIHPIGIGLASWFWDPLLGRIRDKNNAIADEKDSGNTAVAVAAAAASEPKPKTLRAYAPNLIGCGISEGSDAWDPDQRGLFVPLGWVKGCEALMNHVRDDAEFDDNNNGNNNTNQPQQKQWTVVAQGGLAPVGVLLAARNPETITKLVLASPPTWKDMTTPVPQAELERNYNFLRSPVLGKLAFFFLEKRSFIEFFSNLFLFTTKDDDNNKDDKNKDDNNNSGCDIETWLDYTERELCEQARPPVQAFNAGLCMNRSFEEELRTIISGNQQEQPTRVVVVQGENDKRQRSEYTTSTTAARQNNDSNSDLSKNNCELIVVPGTTNVVPWESPEAFADLLY